MAGIFQQKQTAAFRCKADAISCLKEASKHLSQASKVQIIDTPVIDLLTLYPETLPDLMKPSKGAKRKPGSDELLLSAMQKTWTGLRELRDAVRLHPQLAISAEPIGGSALVPY